VLISGHRAATLKLSNQRDAAAPDEPVRVEHAPWLDAHALADPARDLSTPLKGPFRTLPLDAPEAARGAIRLARLAGLVPAFHIAVPEAPTLNVSAAAVNAFETRPRVSIAARARLPISGAEQAEAVAFRSDGNDPVAILIGSPHGRPPLVRLHSECLTGDVFGSLKCDCGPQLDAAVAAIAADGWGMLLYLRQEGRGIGLVNKLRAYALQDQGFDTVDANLRLGFEDDAREFAVAAAMLELLGQREVRLLTNNPRKVAALEAAGITVAERLPLQLAPGAHNRLYLATKRDRSGHLL
jgi:GTP cyclohydrolase II